MTDIDVAIVGAGLTGSATAWALARRGLSVAVYEQYGFGHARGSSHGSARIIRRAYPDPLYIRMTGEAWELWRELELLSGETLLRQTGGVDFGPGRDPEGIAALLSGAGVDHELLDCQEGAARWPGIVFDGPVLFHPQAGTVDPHTAIPTFLRLAGNEGGVLYDSDAVTGIEVADDHAVLRTREGRTSAGVVVVAAGAWVANVLPPVMSLPPLTISQQQICHFARRDASVAWPIFVHKDELSVYGLPGGSDGGAGNAQKVAEHDGGRRTTATDRDGIVDPTARARLVDFVRRRLPGLVPTPFAEATCLYTTTPDEDFVLDRSGPVVVASPCSGHGAKFAPLLGEMVADLVVGAGGQPRFRLSRFSSRTGL